MADSVVRNANKEESDTPMDYDDIVRMLEDDPYALDPLDQDTTTEPEEYIEPMDAIRGQMLEFGGSEMEGGFADAPLGGIDLLDTNYVKPKYIPLEYGGSPGIESIMKKTTIEMQEVPADRNMLVMNRIMKQGGLTQTRDPRLMAQLAQVLGRDG